MASDTEIQYAIMNGISFGRGQSEKKSDDSGRVRTKARKKGYQTGSHRSGAAKHKAEIRERVKNRPSQKKNR